MRQSSGVGADVCVEFRGARRGDGVCRPPLVYLDGAAVRDPIGLFGSFDISRLERIQVISPAESGAALGPEEGWGVIVLQTVRAGLRSDGEIPVALRRQPLESRFDWTLEARSHPSGLVYGSALLGNTLGIAAGMWIVSHCIDVPERRIYRGEDGCGLPQLLGSGVAAALLIMFFEAPPS